VVRAGLAGDDMVAAIYWVGRVVSGWRVSSEAVSESWLVTHAAESGKVGWDGPRWRTPAERAEMARVDRRKGRVAK
jgi:hypothetical protein